MTCGHPGTGTATQELGDCFWLGNLESFGSVNCKHEFSVGLSLGAAAG